MSMKNIQWFIKGKKQIQDPVALWVVTKWDLLKVAVTTGKANLENESWLIKSIPSLRAGIRLVPYAFDKNNRREDSVGPPCIILEFPISKSPAMPRQLPLHVKKKRALCLHASNQTKRGNEKKQINLEGRKWFGASSLIQSQQRTGPFPHIWIMYMA